MGRDHNDDGGGRGRGGNDSQSQKSKNRGQRGTGNQSGKKTTQPNNNRSGSGDVRPKWICKTDDLKNDTFFWGNGMNDQYSSSQQHFLQYAGKSFSGNEKKSIEN